MIMREDGTLAKGEGSSRPGPRALSPVSRTHLHTADLPALRGLAIEAVVGIADLVEELHRGIAEPIEALAGPVGVAAAGIRGSVYQAVRGVTRGVGGALDLALGPLVRSAAAAEATPSAERDALLAALNGVMGDRLAEEGSPLAIPMRLRVAGQPLVLERRALAAAIPAPRGRLLVRVHGLCRSDLQWDRGDGAYERLAAAAGATLLSLHYNSGLHISTNGRQLAALLEELVAAWPVAVEELALVGHSMGGLVARSACHHAQLDERRWLRPLRTLVFLATPHHGAPLERAGDRLHRALGLTAYSAPFARLARLRSAGITDLRHGSLVDDDWQGTDRFAARRELPRAIPLPPGVRCHAIAACRSKPPGPPRGDGLVPVASALGRHLDPSRRLRIPRRRQTVLRGMRHIGLLHEPSVVAALARALGRSSAAARR